MHFPLAVTADCKTKYFRVVYDFNLFAVDSDGVEMVCLSLLPRKIDSELFTFIFIELGQIRACPFLNIVNRLLNRT